MRKSKIYLVEWKRVCIFSKLKNKSYVSKRINPGVTKV